MTNKNPFQSLLKLLTVHVHFRIGIWTISLGCWGGIAAQFKASLKVMTIHSIISRSISVRIVFLQNGDSSNWFFFPKPYYCMWLFTIFFRYVPNRSSLTDKFRNTTPIISYKYTQEKERKQEHTNKTRIYYFL